MAQQISTNTFGCAKWIVSADPTQGTHTTIAGALTSASSGDTIFIRPGTYTENLTFKAGVNLASFACDAFTPNVTIIGKSTFSAAGNISLTGINFQTNSDFVLVFSGTGIQIIHISSSNFNCTNNTGISITNSNTSSTYDFFGIQADVGTTGISLWADSSAGVTTFYGISVTNSGSSITPSNKSAGILVLSDSEYAGNISNSGTGTLLVQRCNFSSVNSPTFTIDFAASLQDCSTASGTDSSIAVGSAGVAVIENVVLSSNGTYAISGTGNIQWGSCTLQDVTAIDPGLTITDFTTFTGSIFSKSTAGAVIGTVSGSGDSFFKSLVTGANNFAWGNQQSSGKFIMAYNGDGTLSGGTEWMNFNPTGTLTTFDFSVDVVGNLEFDSGLIGSIVAVTGAGPHTIAATDYFLSVDTSSVAQTLNFPNAPTKGQIFVIKDGAGNASTNNITISTVGGIVTFDGATTKVLNLNYQSVSIIFDGSNYLIW